MRLRDIAASLGTTERSMYGTVADLAEAGCVVKQKDGRRNRCQLQAHLPQPEPGSQEHTAGDVLALLAGTDARPNSGRGGPDRRSGPASRGPGRIIFLRQLTAELSSEITMLGAVIADLLAGDRGYQVTGSCPASARCWPRSSPPRSGT